MVIKSQATRSRSQNRKIARRILAEKLDEKEKGPESRSALKLQAIRKKKANRRQKARKKYGNLTSKDAVEVVSQNDVTDLKTDDGRSTWYYVARGKIMGLHQPWEYWGLTKKQKSTIRATSHNNSYNAMSSLKLNYSTGLAMEEPPTLVAN